MTLNGLISLEWSKNNDNKNISIKIPVGVTVKFNFEDKSEILVSGEYRLNF